MTLTFIAEVGSNWKRETPDASLDAALAAVQETARLARKFHEFQFAVKFQVWDQLYNRDRAPDQWHQAQTYRLPWDWIPVLAKACRDGNVGSCLSFFDVDEDVLERMAENVDLLKVASGMLTSKRLVRILRRLSVWFEKPLLLSTGATTGPEIRRTLDWADGAYELVLMNCICKYPADARDYNLSRFPWRDLADAWGVSDHCLDNRLVTDGGVGGVGAVGLGYTWFEKHVRPSDTPRESPDHGHSINFVEFESYVSAARRYHDYYFRGPRLVLATEEPERVWARPADDGLRPAEVGDGV